MNRLQFRVFQNGKMRYDVTGFECGEAGRVTGVFLDGDYYPVGPDCIIMQSTGLTDVNNKPIYEGDLVSYKLNFLRKEERGRLLFKQPVAFKYTGYDFGEYAAAYADRQSLTVVGNVHE